MDTNGGARAKHDSGRPLVYAVVIIIALVGLLLMLLANLVPDMPVWLSGFLNMLGVACLISATVTLIQRHLVILGIYDKVQHDLQRMVDQIIRDNIELMDCCGKLGIRKIFLSRADFYRHLETRLEAAKHSLTVVGSALSTFAPAARAGPLYGIIDARVRDGLHFSVCSVKPESSAARYRETELRSPQASSNAVRAAMAFLDGTRRELPPGAMTIRTLGDVVPRGTFICVDDETIFFSPYFCSRPLVAEFVLETREGDALFRELKADLDNLLGRAKP